MEEEQIRNLIARYLENQIDRPGFSQAFAGLYFRVRNNRDASLQARRLCDAVVLPFSELSLGHRTEQSFRAELKNATRLLVPYERGSIHVFANLSRKQTAPETNVFYSSDRGAARTQRGTATIREETTVIGPSKETGSATEPRLLRAVA
jgi:hypothetical protein